MYTLKQSCRALLTVLLSGSVLASQDLYAPILSANLSGTLIEPFEEFNLSIKLNPDDKSVQSISLKIDDRDVRTIAEAFSSLKKIDLHTLVLSHSPVHAPEAEEMGIMGVGPAVFIMRVKFQSSIECGPKGGEVSVVIRMDTLEQEVSSWCGYDEDT